MECDFCGDPIPEGTETELEIQTDEGPVSQYVCEECSCCFDPDYDVQEAAEKLFERILKDG